MDEIQGPARVGLRFHNDRRPRAHGPASRAPLAHREAFFPIQPIDTIDPGRLALLPQPDEQPPIAEALALIGEAADLFAQLGVGRAAGPVADHGAIGSTMLQARRVVFDDRRRMIYQFSSS